MTNRRLIALVFSALLCCQAAASAVAADSAVIFMYHRFGDDRYPSTSIGLDQFDAHLQEIERGGYNVMPLSDIVAAFRRKEALPDRTIAITIDDAYTSVIEEAWPRLRRAGLPFTLFVATAAIDAGRPDYMSWAQIRELTTAGVAIGSQTVNHPHLPDVTDEQLQKELNDANARFNDELGYVPKLLAYPFGEFGIREKRATEQAGFVAAFGQHSGVAYANGDLYGLPRFAMNVHFGSVQRFRLAANALPLRVYDVTPHDTVLRHQNPPAFGFTVEEGMGGLGRLACFASNQDGAARIERLGARRMEVRIEEAFAPGRGRINCTMPAGGDRWRWFGMQFYIPE